MREIVALLLLVLPVAALGAAGAEAEDDPPKVYTNEDLERFAEPGDATEPGASGGEGGGEAATPLPDPLREIESEEARRVSRLAQVQAAEAEVAGLREEVARLEKRALAVRNPYLPRPELPDDEARAWEGLSGPERLKRVEGQLAVAADALRDAEARLDALRAKLAS